MLKDILKQKLVLKQDFKIYLEAKGIMDIAPTPIVSNKPKCK
jgi:hypothetical protein